MKRTPLKPRRKQFSPATYAGIIKRQKGICACGCGEALGTEPRDIEFDHELDLQWGGEDTPENLRALKKKHHLQKTVQGHKDRAKVDRIRKKNGRRNMSAQEKELARMLER